MALLRPTLPDFDVVAWAAKPYAERVRMMCQAWAVQGFGAPAGAYAFYVVKIGLYVGGFLLFASATPGVGDVGSFGDWWAEPVVFGKAVIWTLLFEVLGLGCGSGPLTARYLPPFGGALYWLRPGTTRLPPFPRRVPLTAGHRRTLLDVALYAAVLALAVRALLAAELDAATVLPLVVALPVLGLRDKTIFLAARSEHYLLAAVVLLFPADLLAGSKVVQVALWWGAASSKLNHHFPYVITVMASNSPLTALVPAVRRAMFRRFPDDLRPSRLARGLAHAGTVVEYAFPLVLLLGAGGLPTTVALVVMVTFHTVIMTSFPLGVPLEWNVFFVYSGLVLFGVHAEVPAWAISSPLLAAILLLALVALPLLGNLRPDLVSFLPAMRYYAGNWGTSIWLFRRGAMDRLDQRLVKGAATTPKQLTRLYGEDTARALLGKALAFRSMHLHGRALQRLLPRAVDDLEDYDLLDGEVVAGLVLGWNFGDGHLHHEQLLEAVQAQCGFAPGELRCLFLESQPAGRRPLHWRVADAAEGRLAEGRLDVTTVLDAQPWPAPLPAAGP